VELKNEEVRVLRIRLEPEWKIGPAHASTAGRDPLDRFNHLSRRKREEWTGKAEEVCWHGTGASVDVSHDSHTLAFCLFGRSQEDDDLYVMINSYWEALSFDLRSREQRGNGSALLTRELRARSISSTPLNSWPRMLTV